MITIIVGTLGLVVLAASLLVVQIGFILTFCAVMVVIAVACCIAVLLWICGRGIFYERRKSEVQM